LASRWKENGSFHCPAVAAKTNNNNSNSNLCQCGDPNCCGTTQLATILMVLAAMDVPSSLHLQNAKAAEAMVL
jgi:hypothetical protein